MTAADTPAQNAVAAKKAAPGSTPDHWILMLVLAGLYGSSFTLIKIGVETLAPLTLVSVRLTTAALVLLVLTRILKTGVPSLVKRGGINPAWPNLALLAITGTVVPFSLITWGQQAISSSLAGILMAIMPLVTLGLSALFVPGETVSSRRVMGFLLGFAGLLILFGPSALGHAGGETWPQQIAMLLAAASYGVNAVLTTRRPPMHPVSAAAVIHICAVALIAPAALVLEGDAIFSAGVGSLTAAVALGVFQSALATYLVLELIDRAGPSFTAQINYLVPVWAVGLGFFALGEVPDQMAFVALGLILGGIALAQTALRRPRPE